MPAVSTWANRPGWCFFASVPPAQSAPRSTRWTAISMPMKAFSESRTNFGQEYHLRSLTSCRVWSPEGTVTLNLTRPALTRWVLSRIEVSRTVALIVGTPPAAST